VQVARSSDKVQRLVGDVARYFNVKSIVEKAGYSKVECEYDESTVLKDVREEFKRDLNREKIIDLVEPIIPLPKPKSPKKKSPPEKKYYLHHAVQLLVFQFQNGWLNLVELVPKDDCIILIPVTVVGPSGATLYESETKRQMEFTFETNSMFIISGKCSIYIPPESKVVCVVLCMGRDKE